MFHTDRPRVAYLGSPVTMPGAPQRRDDAYEHDLTVGHLGLGLHYIGRSIESVSWDDANVDWNGYEAVVIGTTWDYTRRRDEFLARLQHIASQTQLFNSYRSVTWNSQKTYLQDLGDAGCETIPTHWCDSLSEESIRGLFDHFGCESLIIKPQVGAGSWRQSKLHRNDPWPQEHELPLGPAIIQPFQPSVITEGELSFIFFGREFSHAVLKKPAANDYRIQSSYGGYDIPLQPTPEDLDAAHSVLNHVDEPLLYARVDMIRGIDGQLKLIELEIIEPYLYPLFAPQMGHLFAKAYAKLAIR